MTLAAGYLLFTGWDTPLHWRGESMVERVVTEQKGDGGLWLTGLTLKGIEDPMCNISTPNLIDILYIYSWL